MRRCPVCYGRTEPTRLRNVAGHLDRAGHVCPMTGQPYDLTYSTHRRENR